MRQKQIYVGIVEAILKKVTTIFRKRAQLCVNANFSVLNVSCTQYLYK